MMYAKVCGERLRAAAACAMRVPPGGATRHLEGSERLPPRPGREADPPHFERARAPRHAQWRRHVIGVMYDLKDGVMTRHTTHVHVRNRV